MITIFVEFLCPKVHEEKSAKHLYLYKIPSPKGGINEPKITLSVTEVEMNAELPTHQLVPTHQDALNHQIGSLHQPNRQSLPMRAPSPHANVWNPWHE